MSATAILLTFVCSATAHLVMTCVMALYARHKVQYLSLAWINGIFTLILIWSSLSYGFVPDGKPGILNPLMMIMLVVGCFLQSIYPLSIPMPGYLQWQRMWKYASPAIVLIVLYLLAFLVGENTDNFQTFADVREHLFSLSMLLRVAAFLLALFYIFNIFMLPRLMVHHPNVPRYLLGYCTVLGLSAIFYLVVSIVYDPTMLMVYIILFTLLNMYLCLRALETMAVSLPQPVIEEVKEDEAEAEPEAETEAQKSRREDFNEANLQRFHRLEAWMQRNPMAWRESTFGRDQLCREVGLNRHLVLQSVRSQGYNNVHDYINRYRIEELKRMIRRGEVATIGETVDAGFGTVVTVRSCFKKMEGITLDEFMASQGAKTRRYGDSLRMMMTLLLVMACTVMLAYPVRRKQNRKAKPDTIPLVTSIIDDMGLQRRMSTSAYPVQLQVSGRFVRIQSDHDQILPIYNENGVFYMAMRLKKGTNWLSGLPRGSYFINNRPVKIG